MRKILVILTFFLLPLALFSQDRYAMERELMVQKILDYGEPISDRVLHVMREIPRHAFVPVELRDYAYKDGPLSIGHGQTISQPFIVAYMTSMLELKPHFRVLEIGTGSGYQAAVLSKLVKDVFTIEIVPELGLMAKERLRKYGDHVQVKIGDGYKGWTEYAPFDAILLTASPAEVPAPLFKQLKEGGILLAPVGVNRYSQYIVRYRKVKGEIVGEHLMPVQFVPMTGKALEEVY